MYNVYLLDEDNTSGKKYNICWTMTLYNLVEVSEVLYVFLCQNLMELFACVRTTIKWILSQKQTHFLSHDYIGHAKYVTKLDLLKGFWQIPLTDRAQEISAFVTPDELYQYKVMTFGMKNSPATFQRLVNNLISNLDECKAYIDDAISFSEEID